MSNYTQNYTQGEWEIVNGQVFVGDRLIAAIGNGVPPKEQYANSKVISAAPKLLEALERLVDAIPCVDEMDFVIEALEKAKG